MDEKQEPITAEERDRVRQEFVDGYPTEKTVAEFLEAHKRGGKEAIKALLERRHAARLGETEEPT
jgi:hypothetical protein